MIYGQGVSRGRQISPPSNAYFVQLGGRIEVQVVSTWQTFAVPLQRHTSKQTIPVAKAVVVAMAGMILPAICLVVWAVAGEIPYAMARKLEALVIWAMWWLVSSSFSKETGVNL
jgi:hypothetical protein